MLMVAIGAMADVADLPGMDTATNMKEWLKLTDKQVEQLEPVLQTRLEKMDKALSSLEQSAEPDIPAFLAERKAIKDEFDAGVQKILTPDQLKQWEAFKAEVEKTLVHDVAIRKLELMKEPMDLTDEQVTKLEPAMVKATQGQIDVLQKLANTGRISLRDKKQAGSALKGVNAELEKSMSAIVSPNQMEIYRGMKEELKKAREEAKKS
jgi:hypothetical protein